MNPWRQELLVKELAKFEAVNIWNEDECNCLSCRTERRDNLTDRANLTRIFSILDFTPVLLFFPHDLCIKFTVDEGLEGPHPRITQRIVDIMRTVLTEGIYSDPCIFCGEPHSDIIIKGERFCVSCVGAFFLRCGVCGEYGRSFSMVRLGPDRKIGHVCQSCVDLNRVTKCFTCGSMYITSEIKKGIGRMVDLYGRLPKTEEDKSNWMCPPCSREEPFRKCGKCGEDMIPRHHPVMCDRCHIYNTDVHAYNFTPPFEIFGAHKFKSEFDFQQNAVYGIELEFENFNSDISRLTASSRIRGVWPEYFLYCVHDGSLASKERGVELVSMPFTWDYWETNKIYWGKLFKQVIQCGFKGDGQPKAGCHIHIDKRAFNTFQMYKFCRFVYAESNRDYILGVSNRVDVVADEYWSFLPHRYINEKSIARHKKNKLLETNKEARRSAVNVNEKTVELRFFQSTHRLERLQLFMEFTKALFIFSRETSNKRLGYTDFLSYIDTKESLYPTLFAFNQKWRSR